MNTQYYLAGLLTVMATTAAAQENAALDACRKAIDSLAKGEIVKIESERKKGVQIYEIDVKAADGSKWEFNCDKASGGIIKTERELPSADHPAFAALKKIDETQARQIALNAYPGTVTEVEYEIEADGTATYEFEIKMADGHEMEVEVDAATGKIVKAGKD